MLGSAVVLLAPTVLPGWALASVLDGSGDRLRKGLLAPALGLLLLYGLNGALLLLGIWSSAVVWVSILAMNIVAYRLVNIRHEVLAKRSRWQLLEAAMHGELSEETDTPSLSKEAEVQLLFRERRSMPLFALGIAIATTALLTPMIQRLPFGVDWIGFAMLTQQMMVEGRLALSGTNEGFWTYPPAFPSVAGWLGATTGVHAGLAVFHLGHYTLFVLLLGMMGALDRHGAGGHAMLAMGLGLGLFAKTFDSGYPSVASQLGIVVGVLVLFRPVEQRQKHHTLALCMALVSVAMIHPTGAIYLALLMLSHILHGIHLESEEHKALMQRFAYVTSAFITVGFALALVVIAPRLFDEAVFSEYGWQGGKPMLVYNGPLLVAGAIAALSLRKTLEGRIAVTWFTMLWLLSFIHLVEGLQHIPVLSLLSYTLYSMALHAYHLPLAILVALWWSTGTELTPHGSEELNPAWNIPKPVSVAMLVSVLLGAVAAQSIALSLAKHEELLAVSPGDQALRSALDGIDGTIYTENMHWGYVWDTPEGALTTSIPTLGLVYLTASEQSNATSAMFADNVSYFEQQGMLHALTSPLGTMQWTLAISPYWQPLIHNDGATLWGLKPLGDAEVSLPKGIDETDCDACVERLDPWRNHKFRDPLGLGEDRPFLPEGTPGTLRLDQPLGAKQLCLVYEIIGNSEGLYLQSNSGLERPFHGLRTDAGYHQSCFTLTDDAPLESLNFTWKRDDPQRWVNPMGLSGRDNVLLDATGVKLQWTEWRF